MLALLHGLTLAIGCGSNSAWCTCLPPREPRTTAEARQYVERAEMAFVAKVLRVENPVAFPGGVRERIVAWDREIVTVEVRQRWRGAPADTLTLHNSSQSTMCGVELDVGRSYFILASRNQRRDAEPDAPLIPWGCGQSRPAAEARRLQRLLGRPGEKAR